MINHLLNQTCTLTEKTAGVSSSGFLTITGSTAVNVYRCRVDVTADESIETGRESPVLRGQIYFPFGTPVTAESVINVTSGSHSGRSFQVNGTPVDDTGGAWGLCCEVVSRLDGLL